MAMDLEKLKPETHEVADSDSRHSASAEQRLSGWRLTCLLLATFVGLFLSLLDTTIVAVSLPTIADHFQDYERSTWILNAYIITYMAFSIVIARLSDIFGQRFIQATCFVTFIAFSMGCALSTSMTQLIVFRALQGIGGSGLYSMTMVIVPSVIRPEKRSIVGALISLCITTSGVLGPILGGAITNSARSTTWPWIFWINLPIGGIALAVLLFAWPSKGSSKSLTWAALTSVDFLGSLLLLAASALLVFALQEAGSYQLAWDSAAIICCLVFSAASFVAFAGWQKWLVARPHYKVKAVFPVQAIARRVIAAGMITTMLAGFVYYIAVVNIPQRFQIVSGISPIMSGVRLIPMLVFSGVGAVVGGLANARRNYTSYTLAVASAFQVLGYGLMTTIGQSTVVPAKQYGFQIFLGLGFGMSMAAATQMMNVQAEPELLAVTQGALAQVRSLGGSVGLAIAVIVFNTQSRSSAALAAILTPAQANALYKSPIVIETFSPAQQLAVSRVFAEAFTQQMKIATYVAAACFLISLLTIERSPPQLAGATEGDNA